MDVISLAKGVQERKREELRRMRREVNEEAAGAEAGGEGESRESEECG